MCLQISQFSVQCQQRDSHLVHGAKANSETVQLPKRVSDRRIIVCLLIKCFSADRLVFPSAEGSVCLCGSFLYFFRLLLTFLVCICGERGFMSFKTINGVWGSVHCGLSVEKVKRRARDAKENFFFSGLDASGIEKP